MTVAAIYCIKNTTNGKRYIGSTVDVNDRWRKHKKLLSQNRHHSLHLQSAWNLYGEESFEFLIIEECEPIKEILLEREQHWMDFHDSHNDVSGYNISPTAGSRLGAKHSEETKKKMSDAKTGVYDGEKNPNYGKHFSEETKKIMRDVKIGKYIGENAANVKLTWKKVYEIRERYAAGDITQHQLASEYGITRGNVGHIINNKIWREKEKTIK